MDHRVLGAALARIVAWLHRANRRHPWSHNDRRHRWIARRLPDRRGAALDVGCGQGLLAWRLSHRFARVLAIDVDGRQAAATAARCADRANVTARRAAFDEAEGAFDCITMVAVLHHLDLDDALAHVRRLLSPGGRLLVVGLARPSGSVDLAWDLLSVATNPLIGFILHPRPVLDAPSGDPFPTKEPDVTLRDLRAACARHLPGARFRRRLGFRHTIEWTAPPR
ncbi:class I SAM-dependent methyltransferase [Microbacterium rhizophilus]|uniref:class I SAM-dependent methyltransferase n=1 Tax=Microbacterium rhizophilus TaxID=3138934 RepID=UPI0031E9B0CF